MKNRILTPGTPELREAPDAPPKLEGYAAVFNAETVIGGRFREKIAPGAFARALDEQDEVVALFNHDPNLVLGRTSNGTLTLAEDSRGLRYSVELNVDDPDAQRVLAKVRRGDVAASSFAFEVVEQDVERGAEALPLRVIKNVRLYDVSAVTTPAYSTTSVAARNADDDDAFVAALERDERQKRLASALLREAASQTRARE